MKYIRAVVALTSLLAFAVSANGFLRYAAAAMPYPDPTAELIARQEQDMQYWLAVFLIGLVLALAGPVWLWKMRRRSN